MTDEALFRTMIKWSQYEEVKLTGWLLGGVPLYLQCQHVSDKWGCFTVRLNTFVNFDQYNYSREMPFA